MVTSWLRVHGILAASSTLAASLCWHCITGWEQSLTGLHRLLVTGWVILEPGTAPAILAVGLGPVLSRLLSALPSGCLLPGQGKRSLLSPRGGTHTPGVQSRSARLCRLWACPESPQPCAPSSARRLARTHRHPGLSCQGFSSGWGERRASPR